jgi:hypothetical protein
VLFLTTPFSLLDATIEHFPQLNQFTIASVGGEAVLINRRQDGSMELHRDLVFHGGPGSTVEMRVFSEKALRKLIGAAGFSGIRVAADHWPQFGAVPEHAWSLPIVARKGEFRVPLEELSREYLKARRAADHLEKEFEKLQADYRAFIAHHDKSHEESTRELVERTEWAQSLDREVTARTEWAEGLNREIEELRKRLTAAQEEKARLETKTWMRLGKNLGALD